MNESNGQAQVLLSHHATNRLECIEVVRLNIAKSSHNLSRRDHDTTSSPLRIRGHSQRNPRFNIHIRNPTLLAQNRQVRNNINRRDVSRKQHQSRRLSRQRRSRRQRRQLPKSLDGFLDASMQRLVVDCGPHHFEQVERLILRGERYSEWHSAPSGTFMREEIALESSSSLKLGRMGSSAID